MKNCNIAIIGFPQEILCKREDAYTVVVGRPDAIKDKLVADLKTQESFSITRMAEEISEAIKKGDFPRESKHQCTRKKKPRKKNKKTHLKKRK